MAQLTKQKNEKTRKGGDSHQVMSAGDVKEMQSETFKRKNSQTFKIIFKI